ncbi:hypothetical protein SNE40_001554 [Patella caerulea]|uniref:N-acetyltransferase domain-containing protein n=1 Tax=Patella caerulea TaxID=87958 RepID=A0AAN8QI56_PATCE
MGTRIDDTLLPELLRKLKDGLPESYKEYSHVKNTIEKKWTSVDFYVDQWPEFTALVIRPHPQKHELKYTDKYHFVYGTNTKQLMNIITADGFINWLERVTFGAVPSRFWSAIDDLLIEKKGEIIKAPGCIVHTITKEELVLHDVPDGMKLKWMNHNEAPELYRSNSKYQLTGVLEYSQALISKFRSLALITKTGQEFVGVASQTYYGTIGFLFVHEQYRGNGCAKVILSHLAKSLLDDNQMFVSLAEDDNTPAIRIHRSVGFKPIALRTRWFRFKPGNLS